MRVLQVLLLQIRFWGMIFEAGLPTKIVMKSERYQRVTLKRVSNTAVEGRFTCSIPKDRNSPRGLLILHPSESIYKKRESVASQLHHAYRHS